MRESARARLSCGCGTSSRALLPAERIGAWVRLRQRLARFCSIPNLPPPPLRGETAVWPSPARRNRTAILFVGVFGVRFYVNSFFKTFFPPFFRFCVKGSVVFYFFIFFFYLEFPAPNSSPRCILFTGLHTTSTTPRHKSHTKTKRTNETPQSSEQCIKQ